jgi:hypothetical protein
LRSGRFVQMYINGGPERIGAAAVAAAAGAQVQGGAVDIAVDRRSDDGPATGCRMVAQRPATR